MQSDTLTSQRRSEATRQGTARPRPVQGNGQQPARFQWLGSGLRAKLLAAHLVLVGVSVGTFVVVGAFVSIALLESRLAAIVSAGVGAGGVEAGIRAAYRESIGWAVVAAAAAGGLAAVLAGLFISGRIAGPVRHMAGAARRIAAGHYEERVRIEAVDPVQELEELASCFNEMAASLEDTERRRAELIADVAHELRTPIFTLEGYLEGLLDGVVVPSQETWARLHGEAGRLRRLVDDLRSLSRVEAGQISFELEVVSPEEVLYDSLEALRLDFQEKDLDVAVHVPDGGLPDVRADHDRAVQVLSNLLANALRYTPSPGRVSLALDVCSGGKEVLFRVADTGIGVAPEHLPQLFERFYRVDKSRSRASGGSGIGLTIAKALTEAMGGRIWAESHGMGQGATFSFTLPVVK